MALRSKRFTVYDVLEANGLFEANSANTQAVDSEGASIYTGPVQFPKMFYHPEGKQRTTVPAEMMVTPFGPKMVNEQKEIIWALARDGGEEQKLRSEGWHDHPAKAIAAGGGEAPSMGAAAVAQEAAEQIAELKRQLAELRGGVEASPPNSMLTPPPLGRGKIIQ